MMTMLSVGLLAALGGPLLYVLAMKTFALDSLSIAWRLPLWLLAAVVLAIAARGDDAWLSRIGIRPLGEHDFLITLIAIVAMLIGATMLQVILSKLGFRNKNNKGLALQQKIFGLSAPHRLFIVVTAAVTEEVLYRGFAIGIGQELWGSQAIALLVSLLVFVAAHFTHGTKALASILWISLVMSLLFVVTNSLLACVLAHFVVDALGTLLVPWLVARRKAAVSDLNAA